MWRHLESFSVYLVLLEAHKKGPGPVWLIQARINNMMVFGVCVSYFQVSYFAQDGTDEDQLNSGIRVRVWVRVRIRVGFWIRVKVLG